MNFYLHKQNIILESFDKDSLLNDSNIIIKHGGVIYYKISPPDAIKSAMYSVIPSQLHRYFSFFYSCGNGVLAPHTDNSLCTIFFYEAAGNFRTTFYKLKKNEDQQKHRPFDRSSLDNPDIYSHSLIDAVDYFEAQSNEVWILNGANIHSVDAIDASSNFRSAWAMDTTQLTFDQVMICIKQNQKII